MNQLLYGDHEDQERGPGTIDTIETADEEMDMFSAPDMYE